MTDEQLSRRLSSLLRHDPQEAGLKLEPGGWVPPDSVLAHLKVTHAQVERVAATSNKGRFTLDGERIRARCRATALRWTCT